MPDAQLRFRYVGVLAVLCGHAMLFWEPGLTWPLLGLAGASFGLASIEGMNKTRRRQMEHDPTFMTAWLVEHGATHEDLAIFWIQRAGSITAALDAFPERPVD